MLVDISTYSYIPLIAVRPSEMAALENLPNKDKDALLPIIMLRGWQNALNLSKSIERIEKAFGDRPWIGDICSVYYTEKSTLPDDEKKPVHHQLISLKNPAHGYKNWCDFVEQHEQVIPCLQLEEPSQLATQIDNLLELNRGIAVRFNEDNIQVWNTVLQVLAAKEIESLYVIIDYGRSGQRAQADLLTYAASVSGFVNGMVKLIPNATFIVSSTTFPSEFSGIEGIADKPIYERQFYQMVDAQCPLADMIYSDRGSVRAETTDSGWSGSPRIDYPLKDFWKISREKISKEDTKDEKKRNAAFRKAAKALVSDPAWENGLDVWGAKEIEAASKTNHITNARHATAVRINIHLHRQLHYNLATGTKIDTDDDWVD